VNPDHLLELATRLASPGGPGAPRQADLKRAVSSAYYAVFHAVMRRAADEFVGSGSVGTTAHLLASRAVDHRALRELCEQIVKPTPKAKLQRLIPEGGFGPELQAFARAVLTLQPKRLDADYDPGSRFRVAGVMSDIATARQGIQQLNSAPAERLRVFLAILLFNLR
jgi:hypothetical protein